MLWESVFSSPRDEHFQSNRILLLNCALFLFSCHCLKLALPFPSHQFTHPICIFPYIHSCRKTWSFALGSHFPPACCSPVPKVLLLLLLSSMEWRWQLPSEHYGEGMKGGQKRKWCLQWEIKWFEHSIGIQSCFLIIWSSFVIWWRFR